MIERWYAVGEQDYLRANKFGSRIEPTGSGLSKPDRTGSGLPIRLTGPNRIPDQDIDFF